MQCSSHKYGLLAVITKYKQILHKHSLSRQKRVANANACAFSRVAIYPSVNRICVIVWNKSMACKDDLEDSLLASKDYSDEERQSLSRHL